MADYWILGQAGEQAPSSVTATPMESDSQAENQAVTTVDANAPAAAPKFQKGFGNYGSLIWIVLMVVVFYFLLLRGPQKQKQQHKKMVQSLKKNDKVRTIGGIIGTIVDIKDDEITLKIDEANNTKIKVIPSAIGRNVSQEK